MKHPLKKKVRVTRIRKLKQAIKEVVHNCLIDIEWYIVNDTIKLLKKRERAEYGEQ